MEAKELRSQARQPSSPRSCVKLRKEQFALRMQRATGQQPKPDQFGKVRTQYRAREDGAAREAGARGGNGK